MYWVQWIFLSIKFHATENEEVNKE